MHPPISPPPSEIKNKLWARDRALALCSVLSTAKQNKKVLELNSALVIAVSSHKLWSSAFLCGVIKELPPDLWDSAPSLMVDRVWEWVGIDWKEPLRGPFLWG